MARRRMIDPNIWTSEDVSKLNYMERLLLIGLFSNADDYGKGKANLMYLRSTIFPYEDIPVKDIEEGLNNISKYICIVFYEIDGSRYYKFTHWNKWQRVDKPQLSVIPEPQNHSRNNSENDSKNGSENDSGLKEDEEKRKEEKRKEDEEEAASSDEPVDNVNIVDNSFKTVWKEYLNNISPTAGSIEAEVISKWLETFNDPQILLKAISEAVNNNAKSLKYIEAVLMAWDKAGLKTIEAVEAHLQNRKNNPTKPNGSQYDLKEIKKQLLGRPSGERQYDTADLEKNLLGNKDINWDEFDEISKQRLIKNGIRPG